MDEGARLAPHPLVSLRALPGASHLRLARRRNRPERDVLDAAGAGLERQPTRAPTRRVRPCPFAVPHDRKQRLRVSGLPLAVRSDKHLRRTVHVADAVRLSDGRCDVLGAFILADTLGDDNPICHSLDDKDVVAYYLAKPDPIAHNFALSNAKPGFYGLADSVTVIYGDRHVRPHSDCDSFTGSDLFRNRHGLEDRNRFPDEDSEPFGDDVALPFRHAERVFFPGRDAVVDCHSEWF